MKKRNKLWIGLLISLLVMAFIPFQALAAGSETVSVVVPVEQIFNVSNANADDLDSSFNYCLLPKDTTAPMPDGSTDSGYAFSLKGTTKQSIGPIVFTHAGLYEYEVKPVIGQQKDHYTYDTSAYTVKINIKNSGDSLIAEVFVFNSTNEKVDGICYTNSYAGVVVPTVPPESPFTGITGNMTLLAILVATIIAGGALIVVRSRKQQHS